MTVVIHIYVDYLGPGCTQNTSLSAFDSGIMTILSTFVERQIIRNNLDNITTLTGLPIPARSNQENPADLVSDGI